MADDVNLPKIAEDAAVAALDEATRKKPRGEITHAIIADASGMRPMTQAEIAEMAERDAEYERMQERAVAQTGFPWNAGARATVAPTHVAIRMNGAEVIDVRFYDGERMAKAMARYGVGEGTPHDGCRVIVAQIIEDETP